LKGEWARYAQCCRVPQRLRFQALRPLSCSLISRQVMGSFVQLGPSLGPNFCKPCSTSEKQTAALPDSKKPAGFLKPADQVIVPMHIPEDPQIYVQGANAFKAIFDGLRSAIGMVRELRGTPGGGSEKEKALVDAAPDTADQATAIAQAEVAKALGYQLRKCEFPPTPMLTVGHAGSQLAAQRGVAGQVYECPKCGYNSALGLSYMRTVPPRTA
jgi:hypothetical protein